MYLIPLIIPLTIINRARSISIYTKQVFQTKREVLFFGVRVREVILIIQVFRTIK